MKNENEKKGLLGRLTGGKKEKKNSCCSGFRIEEIPDESAETKKPNDLLKQSNDCCKK